MQVSHKVRRCDVDPDYITVTVIMQTMYMPVWWRFWKWEKRESRQAYRARVPTGHCTISNWYRFPQFELVDGIDFVLWLNSLAEAFVEMEKFITKSEKDINKTA